MIERLTSDRWLELCDLFQRVREGYPFPVGGRWRDAELLTEIDTGHVLGLVLDSKLRAFLIFRQGFDESEILMVASDPAHRGSGHGKTLIVEFLQHFAAKSVFLEVHHENLPAQKLYGLLGFSRFGERRDYYGPGQHALLYKYG